MEGIEYLYELCEALPRCGPGDNEFTKRVFYAISKPPKHPFILDIGCGTGVQTIELAKIQDNKSLKRTATSAAAAYRPRQTVVSREDEEQTFKLK